MANLHVMSHWRTDEDTWDEAWYYGGNDSIDAHAEFLKTDVSIPSRMALWRGRGTVLIGFTVVEEGGLRRSAPVPREIIATRGTSSATDEAFRRDAPNRSCKYGISFAGGGSRIYDIRGIADIDVVTPIGGRSRLSSYATAKADEMLAWLKDFPGASGKRLVNIVGEPWLTIESFRAHPTNPNWTQFTVPVGVAVPQLGDIVYLRGFNRATELWLKGYWRVIAQNTGTRVFSVPTTYLAQVAEMTPRNLQYRRAVYEYPAWNVIGFKWVSSRKSSGPFDGRAGRSSGVKLRRLTPAV